MLKKRRGMTLIEMLVVVGIITALISIVGFVGPSLTRPAKVNAWEENIKTLQTALMVYANENGEHYPAPPSAATDFTTWAKSSGLAKYLNKPIENPFYKTTPVQIAGSGSPAQIDGATAPTGAVIIYTTSTDANGLEHFTIQYNIGGKTVTVGDTIQ